MDRPRSLDLGESARYPAPPVLLSQTALQSATDLGKANRPVLSTQLEPLSSLRLDLGIHDALLSQTALDRPPEPIVVNSAIVPRAVVTGDETKALALDVEDADVSQSTHPLPQIPANGSSVRNLAHPYPRIIPLDGNLAQPLSEVDWIVPRDERPIRKKTVGERLDPTLITAISEKEKHAFKAKLTGFALNAAIGMQVVLGALTTGLSVVTTGKQTSIMTAILGGLSTIVASYLARARGSNEPELSITRVKDLEQFIRDCEAFKMDHGHLTDKSLDDKLKALRTRFEDLLGNANGERRLSA